MATKHQQMQRIIHQFKYETGKKEVDMHDVVKWAIAHGWPLPTPADPLERLAQEFSRAAREEIRHDEATGKPYRANHAIVVMRDDKQSAWWFDIDEDPPREKMLRALVQRREQMVGDGVQLALDADHWNSVDGNLNPSKSDVRVGRTA
jgi:hypothetical protein